jgi:cytochrome oxidase Cu insertion factor (SCO1/SenC/PrrC family)
MSKGAKTALWASLICGVSLLLFEALLRQGRPSQAAGAGSASAAAEPSSFFSRTPEYDYDPPLPGTYELPPLGVARDGLVVGPDGRVVHLYELFGSKVVILSFIYTRCADPRACLRATGVLSQLHELSRQAPEVAESLQLVTLSFDPGYDTPEVMERYGSVYRQGEGGAEWLFLTTRSQADLQPLLVAYGQRVDKRKKPSPLGPYQHTLKVHLIDPQRRLRNIYSYDLLDPRLVLADIKTLLQEKAKMPSH